LAEQNRADVKSLIGLGYHGTLTPPVILRNILENPGWYTAYTPYQAEIAQGRLEALVNFQTMVTDLTGLPVANASLLDEATAVAEAMALAHAATRTKSNVVVLAADLHPQTRAVLETRAAPLGYRVVVATVAGIAAACAAEKPFALVLQYPGTTGEVRDLTAEIAAVHAAGGLAIVAADPLSLTLLKPPGEMGADVVAVEEDATMAAAATQSLQGQAKVVNAALSKGSVADGPYDVILLEGGAEAFPAALEAQVKEGGRLGAIFMEGALGVARIGYKRDGKVTWRYAFNATAPVAPGFEAVRAFVL
jgi:hypothetical protein